MFVLSSVHSTSLFSKYIHSGPFILSLLDSSFQSYSSIKYYQATFHICHDASDCYCYSVSGSCIYCDCCPRSAPTPSVEDSTARLRRLRERAPGSTTRSQADYTGPQHREPDNYSIFCLTDEQAAAGAEIFRRLIQDYSDELALEALTEDFIDYSSAVNTIRNRGNEGPFVVNAISSDGRAEFMAAQGSQPLIPFDTLNTFHGCDHVATRWQTLRSANGQATETNDIVSHADIETKPHHTNVFAAYCRQWHTHYCTQSQQYIWLSCEGAIL